MATGIEEFRINWFMVRLMSFFLIGKLCFGSATCKGECVRCDGKCKCLEWPTGSEETVWLHLQDVFRSPALSAVALRHT